MLSFMGFEELELLRSLAKEGFPKVKHLQGILVSSQQQIDTSILGMMWMSTLKLMPNG